MAATEREIPDFETFAKTPIFRNLENLNRFSLVVETPKVFQISGAPITDFVVSRMYDEVSRALEAASFFAFDRLKPVRSESGVGVVFDDDDFGFQVLFDADGDIMITRSGSSFRRFHDWYCRLMPSMESLVNRLIAVVADEALSEPAWKRRHEPAASDSHRELSPVRVSYMFQFVAYDFRRPPSDEAERNMSIMTRLLGVVPQEDGSLAEVPRGDGSALQQYGRIDVAVSRWSQNPGGHAREIYRIEAPANRSHSSVWLAFSYIGETFQDPEGTRHVFDASAFLKYFELPYVTFLKDKAIDAFLADLTSSFVFDTTAGLLP